MRRHSSPRIKLSRQKRVGAILLALSVIFPTFSQAAQAPGLFLPESGCNRNFVYKNRTYPVDSNRKLDGEGLRFVMKNSAPAEAMLNDYQSRLQTSYWPAYVGTAGALIAATSQLVAKSIDSELGQRDTRMVLLVSGILAAVGSYTYGQYRWGAKEKVLEKAVETYNDAAPESDKIRVTLTPLHSGKGGQIHTEVPF